MEVKRPVDATVKVGVAKSADTAEAIHGLLDDLGADSAALTLVFYSPEHDARIVARALYERTGERGLGGSTAGEISAAGFTHGAMVGMSWHGADVRAAVAILPDLNTLSLLPVTSVGADLAQRIGRRMEELDPERHAWVLLADGLSGREELLTPFFARHAGRIGLVGGSLADADRFEQVSMVHAGRVLDDAAAIVLLEYGGPFEIFHHTHMEFTDRAFEVTGVVDGGRLIVELDDRPAVEAYAEALGLERDAICGGVTGRHPLGYRFRGRVFPCSIVQATPQGHLQLAYSVEEGERLTLLEPTKMVDQTGRALDQVVDRLRCGHGVEPAGVLLFHCMGRYLEGQHDGCLDALFHALNRAPLCGLNTYGEQYWSMHMNHSMTGIAFG